MIVQEDSFRHQGMRKKLLKLLEEKGITDAKVLSAMNAVPRHFFLDPALDKIAYENRAFQIGEEQTISHPYTVALQTSLLNIQPYDKILEIGTGSAYQASVLAEMKAMVFSIERNSALFEKNKNYFPFKKKYKQIKFFLGDGYKGLPNFAPFDKAIATAGAPFLPTDIMNQLKPNGVFVIPIGENEKQRMKRFTKLENGEFLEEDFGEFSFVPMLGGIN